MKRFRFPLQPLRTLREQKEQIAQQRYAEVLRAVEAAEHLVQETVDSLESSWSWLRDQMTDGSFAKRLDDTRAFCGVLDGRRKEQEAVLGRERERLTEAWQVMMVATQDREVLDRFFEKCQRAHDLDARREEQKTLDELGSRRAVSAAGKGHFTPAKLEFA